MKRIFASTFVLTLAALLSACAIPYETPEARANIERDLKLNSDDIVSISQINWCLFPYGDLNVCQPRNGLGVVTKTNLVLAYFKGGMYESAVVINTSDIQCVHMQNGRTEAGDFYVFTEPYAALLRLVPITGALALEKKDQFLSVLAPPSTETFTGVQGNFIQDTGRKNYSALAVPGGSYVGTSKSTMQIINPCTKGRTAQ
ncbi:MULTISPECIES: hypothetical protein [Pseudomonas]|uniref:hypothetical protein n=1 Tax=Pseudomonas TaxID=286 RepID=UPI001C0A8695|nr:MULTISPECIES: hypothetical protein [Pseudomonas]MCK3838622.1 hypothetical protein [Pseudomonas sp. NCIMB 10586]MCK3844433.1 hypothetical protein [Pseudomonas sp. W15Feb34]VCU64064.1 hypothetical protein [Pseudomonas synxantha]